MPLSLSAKGYPIAVATALGITALYAVAREVITWSRSSTHKRKTSSVVGTSTGVNDRLFSVGITAVLFIGAIVAMMVFGLIWMIVLYVPAQVLVLGERRLWKVALITGACLAIVYFVFYELFLIPLPLD